MNTKVIFVILSTLILNLFDTEIFVIPYGSLTLSMEGKLMHTTKQYPWYFFNAKQMKSSSRATKPILVHKYQRIDNLCCFYQGLKEQTNTL